MPPYRTIPSNEEPDLLRLPWLKAEGIAEVLKKRDKSPLLAKTLTANSLSAMTQCCPKYPNPQTKN
jgi:hypothetical protein